MRQINFPVTMTEIIVCTPTTQNIQATSDQPAMLRMKCPLVATTIAEYFRDQGADVLLMMDSLTRTSIASMQSAGT